MDDPSVSSGENYGWIFLGDCTIKSVNEIGYKFQFKPFKQKPTHGEIFLGKKGSLFRFHQARPEEIGVVVLEVLDSEGNVFEKGEAFITIDKDSGQAVITYDYSEAAYFRVSKSQFMRTAISLQVIRRNASDKSDIKNNLWLRHSSWKIRADLESSGQTFLLDAAFHFEDNLKQSSKRNSPNRAPIKLLDSPTTKTPTPTATKAAITKPVTKVSPRIVESPIPKQPEILAVKKTIAKENSVPKKLPKKDEKVNEYKKLEEERDLLKSELDVMKTSYDEKRARYHVIKQLMHALEDSLDSNNH